MKLIHWIVLLTYLALMGRSIYLGDINMAILTASATFWAVACFVQEWQNDKLHEVVKKAMQVMFYTKTLDRYLVLAKEIIEEVEQTPTLPVQGKCRLWLTNLKNGELNPDK